MKRLSFLFFLMMALGFSTAVWAQQTLVIDSQSDWDRLASNPGDYTTVELNTNSVLVSNSDMVGTENAPFSGTFDGKGFTLNVNIESTAQGAAPFHYISGTTIKTLQLQVASLPDNTMAADWSVSHGAAPIPSKTAA